jgi:hypothetical protein
MESISCQQHNQNFQQLDVPYQARLLIPVDPLSGCGRKHKKGQDKKSSAQVCQSIYIGTGKLCPMKSYQDNECVFEYIVIKGT